MGLDDLLGFFAEDEEPANNKNGRKEPYGKLIKTPEGFTIQINGKEYYCKKEHIKAMLEGKYKYAIITERKNNQNNDW